MESAHPRRRDRRGHDAGACSAHHRPSPLPMPTRLWFPPHGRWVSSASHRSCCRVVSPHHAADSTEVGARAVGPVFGEGDAKMRLLPGLSGFA